MPSRTGPPPVLLCFLDALALIAFVAVGIRSHHESSVAAEFMRNIVPLLLFWFAVAALLHTYRAGDRPWLARLLLNWAVAVPIALAVRTLWVGSPSTLSRFALFLVVAMAFTLLFLLVERILAGFVFRGAERAGNGSAGDQ
jgi:hypothetical protein